MIKRTLAAALTCAWLACPVSTFAQGDGDAAAGETKAALCGACHGADGRAIQAEYPNLAGQHASYIAKQLTDYRDGNRENAIMAPQASALSDADILDLAAWFSSMPKIEGVSLEENLELGENIYRGGITSLGVPACMACHGPTGLGNPAAAWPSLSGQNAKYAADQLRYWRAGQRENDPNRMMQTVSHRLSDAEIEAVSNYIQGLH